MKQCIFFLLVMFFASCSATKQYYNPSDFIEISANKYKKTTNEFKNYKLINQVQDYKIYCNIDGNLKVFNGLNEILDYDFNSFIISANIQDNILLLLSANNDIYIFDLYNEEFIYTQTNSIANGVIQTNVQPLFINNIAAIPTLDGKLVLIDYNNKTLIKTINVGNSDFFNNLIFLKANHNTLIAASSSKIILIPDLNKNYNFKSKLLSIKFVLSDFNNIFIAANDGSIIKYDMQLNEIKKTKEKYANYVAFAYDEHNYLYLAEYLGYVIKYDENLEKIKVFKLNGANKAKSQVFFDSENSIIFNLKRYILK